ncbi:aldehyde dehydrogenase [Gordonia polyisoprenivorans]|uniref:aldehyde dehydrogenase n=1 Tax=Gordonia polyisoprenivorans TaxID=84595 RepID=UPI0003779746|nr:aldehyde dehydrogenase [Gordonia polyisoprenivorans]QUD82962.1 aldehyde dehydrogenase [Gordonia polyisoprenivorans]
MIDQNALFIDGALTSSHASEYIEVRSAATEEVIGRAPAADAEDVDAAVSAARRAFDDPQGWSTWSADERAITIERFADELETRTERLTGLVSSQNGMPISIAGMLESGLPTTVYRYYADLIRSTQLEETRPGLLGGRAIVRQRPVGVVAAIVPWNYPNLVTALKVAPALAAGCTVVLKPSPETILDSYVFADAVAAANIPAGVINIVPGHASTGSYLVSHPDVNKVTFTGSTAVGRQIGKACGELLRPVTLELGGKSAAIILDDADLAANIEGLFQAALLNNGQTCVLNGRILVPRKRFDESRDFFAALVDSAIVGDPLDPGTQVGPLVTDAHRSRVEAHIARAKAAGAHLVTGGGRPVELDRGWYVQPTLFTDVEPSSSLAQEEVFGPVLALMPYDDVDQAVQIANDTMYGLAGTIWTADETRGIQIAERIESGTVGVNYYMLDPVAPFGGTKASGLGRELGPEGLAACMQTHTTYLSTT